MIPTKNIVRSTFKTLQMRNFTEFAFAFDVYINDWEESLFTAPTT